MTQFVILSILLHVWVVTLFGDATGEGQGRRGGTSGTTFTALLRPLAADVRQRLHSRTIGTPTVARPALPPAVGSPADAPAFDTAVTDQAPIESLRVPESSAVAQRIAPLPVIAVEVEMPKGEFVVPNMNLVPIQTPISTVGQVIVPIPENDSRQPPPRSEGGFAIFVQTINEPASIVEPARRPFATPALQSLPVLESTKSLQRYTPSPSPLVEPKAASMPPAGQAVETTTLPIFESPPVEPRSPIAGLPVAPLERISIQPAAARSLDSYIAPAPAASAPTPGNVTAAALPASVSSPAQNQAAAASSDAAVGVINDNTLRPTDSDTGGSRNQPAAGAVRAEGLSPGLSSLLPVVPTPRLPTPPPAPKLDLDSLRQRARELSAEGAGRRTLLPFPTVAQEAPKRNIEKIFDKALSRPNCKDEYANLGLAAVAPLVRDAVKGDGCKW